MHWLHTHMHMHQVKQKMHVRGIQSDPKVINVTANLLLSQMETTAFQYWY